MLHPLFSTLIQRPDLVLDHVSGYAALFQQEAAQASSELLGRAVAWVLTVLAATMFVVLTGVALMLGFLLNQFHWVLVVVPGFVLVLGFIALFLARKPVKSDRFPELKAQLDSDAHALRMAA